MIHFKVSLKAIESPKGFHFVFSLKDFKVVGGGRGEGMAKGEALIRIRVDTK